jgi:hypothetical protein
VVGRTIEKARSLLIGYGTSMDCNVVEVVSNDVCFKLGEIIRIWLEAVNSTATSEEVPGDQRIPPMLAPRSAKSAALAESRPTTAAVSVGSNMPCSITNLDRNSSSERCTSIGKGGSSLARLSGLPIYAK